MYVIETHLRKCCPFCLVLFFCNLKLEEIRSDTLLEVQKYLDEVTKDNKKLLKVSNDSKRQEIQIKANQLDRNLFVRCENLKEEPMMIHEKHFQKV